MSVWQFVLAVVLALCVGFSRLNHLRCSGARADADRDSESVASAAAVHFFAVSGLAASERGRADPAHPADHGADVWETAHVQLKTITLDTDTTVHHSATK